MTEVYLVAAVAVVAFGIAAWKFPRFRGFALSAIALILGLLGAAKYGSALKDRVGEATGRRKDLAATRKQERETVAAINDEVEELNEQAVEAVTAAQVEEALERVAPSSEEERAARQRVLDDAI